MADSVNATIYDILLKSTIDVQLERDGEDLGPPLKCRYLPFTTLTAILGEVAVSAKSELQEAKRRVVQDLIMTGAKAIPTDQLTDIIMPLASAVLYDSPRLVTRILLDVVVDMDANKITLFSVEDVLAILDAVISRLDVNRVSEKARSIFTQATAIAGRAVETQGKKDHLVELAQKSLSQKP